MKMKKNGLKEGYEGCVDSTLVSGGFRIFPRWERQLPGGTNIRFLRKFPKNCMKLKEFGLAGGGGGGHASFAPP